MEMRCDHKILGTSYKEHVANEEVCTAKIQQAIGTVKDLLTIVKRRKLQWCDHVSNSSGLAKTIMQDTGKRKQGRQKEAISEWVWQLPENKENWKRIG